jgi:predicted nucleic acid-binding protein
MYAPSAGGWPVVLVDSTVWIDLLRKSDTLPVRRLRRLIDMGEATVAPVIVQEVLQGATDEAAFGKLHGYFAAIPLLGTDDPLELHIAAGHLYARARWHAITPRSPHDCLVAATAIDEDVLLLHDDQDFERLAQVEPRLRLISRR